MPDFHKQLQNTLGAQFTVTRELGGGGMSRVFLVHDTKLERDIVVKVLSPDLAATISVDRFTREIKLAAGLQQANIVPVLNAGEMDALPFYTMPYVEGRSLRQRMNDGPPFKTNEVVKILGDVACALDYAHSHSVVHRDIKPENILLSGGTAVVTDFGIAKAFYAAKTQAPGGTLTVVGTSLGTPAYMAPEQAVGDPVDQRADIYAWGVVAYEMLSGKHPFAGKTTAQQLIAAHIAETPAPLHEVSNAPADLADLVMKALQKDPTQRPQNAAELRAHLEQVSLLPSAETPQKPLPQTKRAGSSGSRRWIYAGVAAAALVAATALALSRRNSTPTGTVAAKTDSAITTVAVLPFTNIGGNPQDEYFSDGMTDELARALSKVPELQVASRTSSYAFKGKTVAVEQIAQALHVRGVIEGAVQRSGNQLRVTAQLTDAHSGLALWSDRFQRPSTNVFEVQDELTSAIVSALTPQLRRETGAQVAASSRGTDNREAYDLYLRGRYSWNERTASGLRAAIGDLNRAIEIDPHFARGYAALASAYTLLPQYGDARQYTAGKTLELTEGAARRALELDSTLAEPHAAVGLALQRVWRWDEAQRELVRATQLDSTYATAYQWYAFWLFNTGQRARGMEILRRAGKLDPLSRVIAQNLCLRTVEAGDFAGADTLCARMRAAGTVGTAALGAGQYFLHRKLFDSAAHYFQDYGEPNAAGGLMVYSLVKAGRSAEATRIVQALGPTSPHVETTKMLYYLALGDRKQAMDWLERTVAARDEALTTTVSPLGNDILNALRTDPRFRDVLAKMGLTEYAKRANLL